MGCVSKISALGHRA